MPTTYNQIVEFLKALDKLIDNETSLYIIGGGAITLAIDKENRTVDVDAVEASPEIINKAGKESRLAMKFGIYIQKVSEIGFAAPADWRQRVKLINNIKLNNLKIYVAEIHDIVLGKIARLEHRDIEDISDLAKKQVLNIDYLIKRLNENINELKRQEYCQNAKMLFDVVFNKNVVFKKGQAFVN